MKKKILIGAGILFTVFIVFLIALCGGSGTDKIVTEEELKTMVSNVTCEVKDDDNITYQLSTLTNDISFDNELQNKQYTKITINQNENFKSLGLAFIVKSNEEFTLNVKLNKNDTVLKSTSLNLSSGNLGNVNLLLDEAVDISTTDDFTITFEQSTDCNFTFDTLLLFFDEV